MLSSWTIDWKARWNEQLGYVLEVIESVGLVSGWEGLDPPQCGMSYGSRLGAWSCSQG